ncbi:ATP synthase regulation protein NCA2 [Xylona heveae TC161]|uniref:ATP synthase regulation protein NCA2 n=1 Tax=Xylona heveae (strain CBS 132557 / TC161) TaxID=1328760 RepID=A0A165FQP0_XYLHT|nr:ATP synthase regulation protein NCA2 [Xylona heveae TC161]KZF21261.1 ATP synthase regulation protein NCA2 [Xylona heveae TC161]
MTFVTDQVRRVDSQLDRLQLFGLPSAPVSPLLEARRDTLDHAPVTSTRASQLQIVAKALSASATSQPILKPVRICSLLEQAQSALAQPISVQAQEDTAYERDLEWLIVSKAATQTYGVLLNVLLDQIMPLSNDIWYWDDILGSRMYTGLYSIQTSPLRFWKWSKEVYHDARQKLESITGPSELGATASKSLTDRWTQFYGLVKESVRERSLLDIHRQVVSPFALVRAEVRRKQAALRKFREMSASGLGVLMDEGLAFGLDDESLFSNTEGSKFDKEDWKLVVAKSIALMETVLRNVTAIEVGLPDFEDTVFASIEEESDVMHQASDESSDGKPAALCKRLQDILESHIPGHNNASKALTVKFGRPSRLTRYWLPAIVLILSSSTLLRILASRQAEIATWIRELGTTIVDFWSNWVIEPTKKVLGTIRHDKDSEIAIMSKESLAGDRASLERMVVDFAVDHPAESGGAASLSEAEISSIRDKVKEGDLTPVLKAYERDLRKPFMGTVRGDLVRALLIQVQKTKVDVEVAMGGIDSLLKSQELVFGFVGLTPGILVCIASLRWVKDTFGSRSGSKEGKRHVKMVRVLRNIDRILSASSSPSSPGSPHQGMLSYKEHGLLLCEVHTMRQTAQRVLPGEIHREFLEDIEDLVDIRTGVERQLKVVERIRWAYAKWLR